MMNEFEKHLIENKIEIIDGLDKAGSGERKVGEGTSRRETRRR